MNSVYEVTKQDFAAVKAAFDDRDYLEMNICSNRIMANVVFGDQKLYALPGFFMKNLALEFSRVDMDSTVGKELRTLAEIFIVEIEEAFTEEVNLHLIWKAYFDYTENKRKSRMTSTERAIYRDNKPFTSQACSRLTDELFDEDVFFHDRSLVTKGILSEGERLVRNHGAENKDMVLLSLVLVLDQLNDYVKVACSSESGVIDKDCRKSRLSPFLDRIKSWYEQPGDLPYPNAADTLCDMLLEWRKYFIRYMERDQVSVSERQRIELPTDARKRIGDTIAQALEKDLKDKRRKDKERR